MIDKTPLNLWLADDDEDDCLFFKEALEELPVDSSLVTVSNGEELMLALATGPGPDILFLDLNMPRKNGFECLCEIKLNEHFRSLPVIIYSTSFNLEVVKLLYEKGAHLYIRKPGEFFALKKVILEALSVAAVKNPVRPAKEKFVIQV
ncbi:MAG TPA: response regulator [Chryseolinea sp.]|nr:response regulator [Chryseolinea sp.]